uniref:Tetraspanin 9 n=1 Tax=Felis catus TaxID=9685 RepID=A0ABI7ZKG8_FELCA
MPNLNFPASIQFLHHTVPFTNTWRPCAPGEANSGSSSRVSADRTYYTPRGQHLVRPKYRRRISQAWGRGRETGRPGSRGTQATQAATAPGAGRARGLPGSSRSLPASGRGGSPGPRWQGGGVVRTPRLRGGSEPRGGRGGRLPEGSPEGGHAWPWTPVPSAAPASPRAPSGSDAGVRPGGVRSPGLQDPLQLPLRVPAPPPLALRTPSPRASGCCPSAPPRPAAGPAPRPRHSRAGPAPRREPPAPPPVSAGGRGGGGGAGAGASRDPTFPKREFKKCNMARGCLCCLKYMMFLFNLIFWALCWVGHLTKTDLRENGGTLVHTSHARSKGSAGQLCGCGLLGVGIWLSVSQGNFATFSPSFPSLSAANLVIAIGTIVMVTGFLGCLGAIKENKCLLLSFFIVLLIILLAELILLILFFVYMDKVNENAKKDLKEGLLLYNTENNVGLKNAWNIIQAEMRCCGVTDYTDWYPVLGENTVPDRCCMENSQGCGRNTTTPLWRTGCYEKVKTWFDDNKHVLGTVGMCILIMQVRGLLGASQLELPAGPKPEAEDEAHTHTHTHTH